MLALRGDAEERRHRVCLSHAVAARQGGGRKIELDAGGDAPMTLECRLAHHAAGLDAPATARRIEGMPNEAIPQAYLPRATISVAAQRPRFQADLSGADPAD